MTAAASARASSSTTTMAPMGLLRRGMSNSHDPHTEGTSLPQQGYDGCPHLLRKRTHRSPLGAVAGVVDVHVHEPALGSGHGAVTVRVALEQPDAVDHRRRPDLVDDQTHVHRLGVADLAEVAAADLGHDADRRQRPDVGADRLREVHVDRGVDQLEVDRIVHVAVDVVVGPAGGRLPPRDVVLAAGRWGALAHGVIVAHGDLALDRYRTGRQAGSASRSRWLITAETPSPRMVTPYSASPTSMVRFWWVITSSWEFSRSSS